MPLKFDSDQVAEMLNRPKSSAGIDRSRFNDMTPSRAIEFLMIYNPNNWPLKEMFIEAGLFNSELVPCDKLLSQGFACRIADCIEGYKADETENSYFLTQAGVELLDNILLEGNRLHEDLRYLIDENYEQY